MVDVPTVASTAMLGAPSALVGGGGAYVQSSTSIGADRLPVPAVNPAYAVGPSTAAGTSTAYEWRNPTPVTVSNNSTCRVPSAYVRSARNTCPLFRWMAPACPGGRRSAGVVGSAPFVNTPTESVPSPALSTRSNLTAMLLSMPAY